MTHNNNVFKVMYQQAKKLHKLTKRKKCCKNIWMEILTINLLQDLC